MTPPHRHADEQLRVDLALAAEGFRNLRLREEPGAYSEAFDKYWDDVENLIETTDDLRTWQNCASQIMADNRLFNAFRYLTGPPISLDDLKTITDTNTITRRSLRDDPELAERIVHVVLDAIDRRRFPWVREGLDPTEIEKNSAILATAALMATQRIETQRRHEAKTEQETRVVDALSGAGFAKMPRRKVDFLADAPSSGQFCLESVLGRGKADFLVGLWDRRVMAIECKVSNSATNSVKRLNREVVAKAKAWHVSHGDQVVPTAVLSGVYKLHNLQDAQDRGLMLFWAHDLKSMMDWIESTRRH